MVAAIMTQELAVTLPPLLLLSSILYSSRPPGKGVARLLVTHAPYWGVLIGYFGLRYLLFGSVDRGDLDPSTFPMVIVRGLRALWLSPTMMLQEQRWLVRLGAAGLMLLLICPLVAIGRRDIGGYIRGTLYFGVGWPVITLSPLWGAYGQRHLYLASVGVAVSLGLAGAFLLKGGRAGAITGRLLMGTLLAFHGSLLVQGVADFARNGELSYQVRRQIDGVAERIAGDEDAILVLVPEVPDKRRVFWAYGARFALRPPLMEDDLSLKVLPSLDSYGDDIAEWWLRYGPILDRIDAGEVGPIYVVEWDDQQGAFVTRVLDRAGFQTGGYIAPGGPLVREGVRH